MTAAAGTTVTKELPRELGLASATACGWRMHRPWEFFSRRQAWPDLGSPPVAVCWLAGGGRNDHRPAPLFWENSRSLPAAGGSTSICRGVWPASRVPVWMEVFLVMTLVLSPLWPRGLLPTAAIFFTGRP